MGLCLYRSLQGNKLSGYIPSVIGLMQALAVLYVLKLSLTQNFGSLNIEITLTQERLSYNFATLPRVQPEI